MNLSDWQKKKIEILAQYQETIADLYALVGEKVPGYNSLLLTIAIKNLKYAEWLRSLPEKIMNGDYEYQMMRFKIESIITALNYLNGEFESIKENNVTVNSALGILMGVESSDLSAKFYEIVNEEDKREGELEDLKNIFKLDKKDTLKSLKTVKDKRYDHELRV